MKLFMLVMISISSIYMHSSHPVILMALILTQAVISCLMIWVNLKVSWFSYILFLIFLGGLMVLFIYITSLASNEEMKLNNVLPMITLITMIFFAGYNIQPKMNSQSSFFLMKTFNIMYSWNTMGVILTTMIYLLLTLIIVVKISNKFEAPLKNLIFK